MSPARLFPDPNRSLVEGLEALPKILREVLPLKAKHRASLPGAIRRLSAFLTVERENLPKGYMTKPEYQAAYLNYFLPWNIYRQGRLLQGLGLDLADGTRVVDLGAGPLTFLLALWLARPSLRSRAIEYLGLDLAEPPLKAGRRIFTALGGDTWQVKTERRPAGAGGEPADLLVAANFLNELETARRDRRPPSEDGDANTPEDRLLERWESMVSPEGAVLLIEPGMRASARQLSKVRQTALQRGWHVAAPCPHAGDCPIPGLRGKPWCHFTFRPYGAPDWLARFSRDVRLPKERASLSFLLLTRGADGPVSLTGTAKPLQSLLPVRVVSEPFDLPAETSGQYACCEKGMVLLQHGERTGPVPRVQPGDKVQISWPARPVTDRKSGALIIPRSK